MQNKKKVLLLAMTGFGNTAFQALSKMENVELAGVFTPKRKDTPFPYYRCRQLVDVVRSKNKDIKIFEGLSFKANETYDLISELSPDLIVVSTFDQIIPKSIIDIPPLGVINVHPSPLPKYRGATPIFWVLRNSEKKTGITCHFIEDSKIDSGRIINSIPVPINKNDTNSILRLRMRKYFKKTLKNAVQLVFRKRVSDFPKQDESRASYFGRRGIKYCRINPNMTLDKVKNIIRASMPYPLARLNYCGREYGISGVRRFLGKKTGIIEGVKGKTITIKDKKGYMKFRFIKVF